MSVLYSATFTDTNGAAWPVEFTTSQASVTTGTIDIQSNRGRMLTSATNFHTLRAIVGAGSWDVEDGEVVVTMVTQVTGMGQAQVILRGSGTWDGSEIDSPTVGYKALINFAGNIIGLYKRVDGVTSLITTITQVFQIGNTYRVRFRVEGTTLRLKVWDTAGPEPGVWHITSPGETDITGPGQFMMTFRNLSSGARELHWDNLALDDLDPTPTGTMDVAEAADVMTAVGNASNAGNAGAVGQVIDIPRAPMRAPTVLTPRRPAWRFVATAAQAVFGVIAAGIVTDEFGEPITDEFGNLIATDPLPEQDDVMTAVGGVPATGNITEEDDVMVAAGSSVVGSLAVTEDPDTMAASATHSGQGGINVTEADDVMVAVGNVVSAVVGSLAVTEADDVMVGLGQAVTNVYTFEPPHDDRGPRRLSDYGRRRQGVSRSANRLSARYPGPRSFSVLKINGEYVMVQGPSQRDIDASTEYYAGGHVHDVSFEVGQALSNSGFPVNGIPQVFGVHRTEADDVMVAVGQVRINGIAAITEADDEMAAAGEYTFTVVAAMAVTEEDDVLVASGTVSTMITGFVEAVEEDDVMTAEGGELPSGSIVVTEADDACVAEGEVTTSGAFAATEDDDVMVATGTAQTSVTGTLIVTEEDDVMTVALILLDHNGDPILDADSNQILVTV